MVVSVPVTYYDCVSFDLFQVENGVVSLRSKMDMVRLWALNCYVLGFDFSEECGTLVGVSCRLGSTCDLSHMCSKCSLLLQHT